MNDRIKELAKAILSEPNRIEKDTETFTFTHNQLINFSKLLIEEYEIELKESRREVKSNLGFSRIGLNHRY